MNFGDIKPGMVFRENDKRFNRWIRILGFGAGFVEFDSSMVGPAGPFDMVRRKSRKPHRFHEQARSSGYSLVLELNE